MQPKIITDNEWETIKASCNKFPLTESEILFEKYIQQQRLDYCYEPTLPGITKHPDFAVRHNKSVLLFEIKERVGGMKNQDFSWFDPCKGIRDNIKKAAKQFKETEDYCCCVVIANQGDPNTLLEADIIFSAMLGDLGFTFPILGTDKNHRTDTVKNVFLPRGGKMVKPNTNKYENTTIAAVIALEEVRLRNTKFECLQNQEIQNEQSRLGRQLSPEEQAAFVWREWPENIKAVHGPIYKYLPRVIVCENPGARIPFPRDLLCGPFDERWAIVDEHLCPIYAGVRVNEIEAPCVSEDVCLLSITARAKARGSG